MAGKFAAGERTYVVIIYLVDMLTVSVDLVLSIRSSRLDHLAGGRTWIDLNDL